MTPTFTMKTIKGSIVKTPSQPEVAFKTEMFLEPKDVSFQFLGVQENNSTVTGTGCYQKFTGKTHRTSDVSGVANVFPPKPNEGSRANLTDTLDSGIPPDPNTTGDWHALADFDWVIVNASKTFTKFPPSDQVAIVEKKNGVLVCTMSKGGASEKSSP